MKTISAIESQQRKRQRVNIHIEGRFAFSLDAFVAAKENLSVGQVLSDDQLALLVRQDEFQRCYDGAVRFLGYRPRSEEEVKQRLRKRGFGPDTIAGVLAKLTNQGFLDDTAFAQFWLDSRQTFSPRGERLLKLELRQKGVAQDTIKDLTTDIDDEEAAYRASQKKLRSLSNCDSKEFRQRMGAFLLRRGFGYEVASSVIARLLQEREGNMHQ